MKDDDPIPCSECEKWGQETKTFSCNPNKCNRLSNWLLKYAPNKEILIEKTVQPMQYVV